MKYELIRVEGEHIPPSDVCNAFQLGNLKILADGLWSHTPPPEFGMADYAIVNGLAKDPEFVTRTCGTVACAAGHGPIFGILAKPFEGWPGYQERVFGVMAPWSAYYDDPRYRLWTYLFHGKWSFADNTPFGAAARIYYFLEYGLPRAWTASRQHMSVDEMAESYRVDGAGESS